jgi:hypothetical protein
MYNKSKEYMGDAGKFVGIKSLEKWLPILDIGQFKRHQMQWPRNRKIHQTLVALINWLKLQHDPYSFGTPKISSK